MCVCVCVCVCVFIYIYIQIYQDMPQSDYPILGAEIARTRKRFIYLYFTYDTDEKIIDFEI